VVTATRAGPTLLVEAIRAAMAGDVLISPSITVRLLRRLDVSDQPSHAAGTAKTHVANIQRKLRAPNRVGVAAWAWRRGHATA
jgi:DNA-binding NarL/FixJ family response regulator